jgi:hypothetical protein
MMSWTSEQQRLAAVVLACVTIGCGGGGGAASPPPGSRPSTNTPAPADTTPPHTGVAEVHQTGTHNTNTIWFTPGSEAGATFEGSLDGAAFVAISVPWELTGLSDGEHTVAIRARDAAGNVDQSPFTFTWTIDTQAPAATIAFPLPVSTTDAPFITVRGSASDLSAIASVTVNGIPAQTTNGFATWSAVVPLFTTGATAIAVATSDTMGHQSSITDSATVYRTPPLLSEIRGMDYDATNDRIVVSDRRTNTIYGFDAKTGEAKVISPNQAPGSVPLSNIIEGLVVDESHNRALVVDSLLNALVAIDLDTGTRSVVTNSSNFQPEAQFMGSIGIALDEANNRAFVGNGVYASIIEVNLATGDRTVIARSMPGDLELFFNPVSLVYDDHTIPSSPRLIVADVSGNVSKIIHIDLDSGIRTLFVPTGPSLGTPIAMTLDAARNRLLVLDDRSKRLLAVDLSTAHLSVLGSNEDGLGEFFDPTYGIAIRTSPEPRILTGQRRGELLSTDAITGAFYACCIPLGNWAASVVRFAGCHRTEQWRG